MFASKQRLLSAQSYLYSLFISSNSVRIRRLLGRRLDWCIQSCMSTLLSLPIAIFRFRKIRKLGESNTKANIIFVLIFDQTMS